MHLFLIPWTILAVTGLYCSFFPSGVSCLDSELLLISPPQL